MRSVSICGGRWPWRRRRRVAVGGRVCRRKGMWGEEAGRSPPARVEGDQGTEVGKERKGEATWW